MKMRKRGVCRIDRPARLSCLDLRLRQFRHAGPSQQHTIVTIFHLKLVWAEWAITANCLKALVGLNASRGWIGFMDGRAFSTDNRTCSWALSPVSWPKIYDWGPNSTVHSFMESIYPRIACIRRMSPVHSLRFLKSSNSDNQQEHVSLGFSFGL